MDALAASDAFSKGVANPFKGPNNFKKLAILENLCTVSLLAMLLDNSATVCNSTWRLLVNLIWSSSDITISLFNLAPSLLIYFLI